MLALELHGRARVLDHGLHAALLVDLFQDLGAAQEGVWDIDDYLRPGVS